MGTHSSAAVHAWEMCGGRTCTALSLRAPPPRPVTHFRLWLAAAPPLPSSRSRPLRGLRFRSPSPAPPQMSVRLLMPALPSLPLAPRKECPRPLPLPPQSPPSPPQQTPTTHQQLPTSCSSPYSHKNQTPPPGSPPHQHVASLTQGRSGHLLLRLRPYKLGHLAAGCRWRQGRSAAWTQRAHHGAQVWRRSRKSEEAGGANGCCAAGVVGKGGGKGGRVAPRLLCSEGE